MGGSPLRPDPAATAQRLGGTEFRAAQMVVPRSCPPRYAFVVRYGRRTKRETTNFLIVLHVV